MIVDLSPETLYRNVIHLITRAYQWSSLTRYLWLHRYNSPIKLKEYFYAQTHYSHVMEEPTTKLLIESKSYNGEDPVCGSSTQE